ncbi:MAG: hypothetical protein IJZ22_03570 [Bacteroidaceae bacterium]|nr:hypothetical protein [Bacteroidaceae bacterium]
MRKWIKKRRESYCLTSINLRASPNALYKMNIEETIFPRREYTFTPMFSA